VRRCEVAEAPERGCRLRRRRGASVQGQVSQRIGPTSPAEAWAVRMALGHISRLSFLSTFSFSFTYSPAQELLSLSLSLFLKKIGSLAPAFWEATVRDTGPGRLPAPFRLTTGPLPSPRAPFSFSRESKITDSKFHKEMRESGCLFVALCCFYTMCKVN
jgi:hypothetical protein